MAASKQLEKKGRRLVVWIHISVENEYLLKRSMHLFDVSQMVK